MFEERIWLEIIILTFCLTNGSLRLSLSLSLFSLCTLLFILEWLLFAHLLFLHITNSYFHDVLLLLFGGIYAVQFNLKRMPSVVSSHKIQAHKDRLFFDLKYVPILISTFFFEMKNAKMKSRRLFISCKTFITWKIDV